MKTVPAAILCLTLLTALTAAPAHADHEDAFLLREAGEILPFDVIVERAQALAPGLVLEAELEKEGTRYVYELEMLTEGGKHAKLHLDAKTGEVLERED